MAVEPDRTLTLALPKTGVASVAGDLFLADIAIPATVYERVGIEYDSPFDGDYWVELVRHGRPSPCVDTRVPERRLGNAAHDRPASLNSSRERACRIARPRRLYGLSQYLDRSSACVLQYRDPPVIIAPCE